MDCYETTQNLPTEKRKFGLMCNQSTKEEVVGHGIELRAFYTWVLNGNELFASSSKLSLSHTFILIGRNA
jgi:hypothetical protein